MEDATDTSWALHSPPANDNEPHIGMNGKPCRCTPERRAWYTRGCADTCPCHGLPHARCPKAKPCLGDCGRLTTPTRRSRAGTAPTAPQMWGGSRSGKGPRHFEKTERPSRQCPRVHRVRAAKARGLLKA
jgi:hypothetical protein